MTDRDRAILWFAIGVLYGTLATMLTDWCINRS